jgi:hypothetical protein
MAFLCYPWGMEALWVAAAFALGLLANRLGLPPLVGYLGAGLRPARPGLPGDRVLGPRRRDGGSPPPLQRGPEAQAQGPPRGPGPGRGRAFPPPLQPSSPAPRGAFPSGPGPGLLQHRHGPQAPGGQKGTHHLPRAAGHRHPHPAGPGGRGPSRPLRGQGGEPLGPPPPLLSPPALPAGLAPGKKRPRRAPGPLRPGPGPPGRGGLPPAWAFPRAGGPLYGGPPRGSRQRGGDGQGPLEPQGGLFGGLLPGDRHEAGPGGAWR